MEYNVVVSRVWQLGVCPRGGSIIIVGGLSQGWFCVWAGGAVDKSLGQQGQKLPLRQPGCCGGGKLAFFGMLGVYIRRIDGRESREVHISTRKIAGYAKPPPKQEKKNKKKTSREDNTTA